MIEWQKREEKKGQLPAGIKLRTSWSVVPCAKTMALAILKLCSGYTSNLFYQIDPRLQLNKMLLNTFRFWKKKIFAPFRNSKIKIIFSFEVKREKIPEISKPKFRRRLRTCKDLVRHCSQEDLGTAKTRSNKKNPMIREKVRHWSQVNW